MLFITAMRIATSKQEKTISRVSVHRADLTCTLSPQNPSVRFALRTTSFSPSLPPTGSGIGSSPTDARPSALAIDLKKSSFGLSTCSDSPLPPGKSGPGVPRRQASRILLTYLALVSVIGQTGMYSTLESPLPLCSKSTAWMAVACQQALDLRRSGQKKWPRMALAHQTGQEQYATYCRSARRQSHQVSPAGRAPSSGPARGAGAWPAWGTPCRTRAWRRVSRSSSGRRL